MRHQQHGRRAAVVANSPTTHLRHTGGRPDVALANLHKRAAALEHSQRGGQHAGGGERVEHNIHPAGAQRSQVGGKVCK